MMFNFLREKKTLKKILFISFDQIIHTFALMCLGLISLHTYEHHIFATIFRHKGAFKEICIDNRWSAEDYFFSGDAWSTSFKLTIFSLNESQNCYTHR